MAFKELLRRRWKWLLVIVPVSLVVVVSGATFVYIHFIAPDPAPKPTFANVPVASGSAGTSGSSTAGAGDPAQTAAGAIDGTWKIASGSLVQYRVQEVLNGQDNEATGSTTAVTGQLTIAGTTVSSASFSADMTKVTSSEDRRDDQFQNRIMETDEFPAATFELTTPIELSSIPDNLVQVTVPATGKLTLHGTTNTVTFDLQARRNGAQIEVIGTIPITFSDYKIDNPSGGPASVGDDGNLEVQLVLTK
jgi:polyisoprenoid-binding protein YceI